MYLVISWRYVESLCRKIASEIIEDAFIPDRIVALVKGGVFAGSFLCDYLGVSKIECLDVREEGRRVGGKKTLLVDDFINTGNTMKKALKLVEGEVRTASLLMLENSEFIPDYLGDYLTDHYWVIFPWNIVEDLSELIRDIMREWGEISQSKLRRVVSERGLNIHSLEAVFPGKFEEVLQLMELKGIVRKRIGGGKGLLEAG
uniref:Phosphoribosyltransferase n=1 Tax=Archaeoglobus fulgidus TaxID=2234 RepID=A0A7C3ZGS8_ARCFL